MITCLINSFVDFVSKDLSKNFNNKKLTIKEFVSNQLKK